MKTAVLILSAGLALTLSGCSDDAGPEPNRIPPPPQASRAAVPPAPHGCLHPPPGSRCAY
jgi:hypothetical protein